MARIILPLTWHLRMFNKNSKTMTTFKNYRRKQIAELRPIEQSDIDQFEQFQMLVAHKTSDNWIPVSISDADLKAGSPKIGDMVARNPKNHLDQWLVAKQYFEDNFEPI